MRDIVLDEGHCFGVSDTVPGLPKLPEPPRAGTGSALPILKLLGVLGTVNLLGKTLESS